MNSELKRILEQLVAYPLRNQIKVDFDLRKRNFRFSVPVYYASKELPISLKTYVESRKNLIFRPHATRFVIEEDKKILVIQELPFQKDFQDNLRRQVEEFWQLAKQCHRMLHEIATEEKFKAALYLDSDF